MNHRVTLPSLLLLLAAGSAAAQAPPCPPPGYPLPGAPVFIAGEVTSNLQVYNAQGALLDGGDCNYDVADGFAVGDVDADGSDEIVVAGDVDHHVEIREIGNIEASPIRWFGDYTTGDGFAVGPVLSLGRHDIVIAGDGTGRVDVFNKDGALLKQWVSNFDALDELALGNLRGDDRQEILVVGDLSGNVYIYDVDGNLLDELDLDWDIADGFAVGNLDGAGYDEIVIAGDVTSDAHVYDANGNHVRDVEIGYTINDGFAIGDLDGDGVEEMVVAGNMGGQVDAFDQFGASKGSFPGDFTHLDGLAVGQSGWPDMDRDGLLDSWEELGFDADGDTVVDVDLPAAGVRKCHKDLLLEFDWVSGEEPSQWAIRQLKAAFARAPIDAGGTPNPDGTPGINLIVDTGSLTDPSASENVPLWSNGCSDGIDDDVDGDVDAADDTCREGGAGSGSCRDFIDNDADGFTDERDGDCREGRASCSDGFDNDADGLMDAADPDCLVGDDLGGGNSLTGDIDELGSVYFSAKSSNFASSRRRLFRYGISGDPNDATSGGRGEIGGNDFVEYNHDPGTIMHELGHTLNLTHGGTDHSNCKPNFISVMNYDHQGGIFRADGSWNLDYSPPLRLDGSRGGALPTIVEDALDETAVLDPTDPDNLMIFTDDSDAKRTSRLDVVVDWEGDGAADDTNTTVNVDDSGTDGKPEACWNGIITSTLDGHDDWSVLQLNFRGWPDYADAAYNPVPEREPRIDEVLVVQRSIQRTDLAVTMTDSADPAIAGTALQYVTTVRNAGKNATSVSQLRVTLPAGVTHVSTPGCVAAGNELTCDLGMTFPGQERVFTTSVLVAADLVHVAGAPTTIAASATVRNVAGDDVVSANDAASQPTLVRAEADLQAASVTLAGAPTQLLIGETASATLTEVVANDGPSSPMDARVTRTANAAADAMLAVAEPVVVAPALAQGAPRTLSTGVSFACTQPGMRSFTLGSSVAPARPDDTDPNAANDDGDAGFALDCVVPVGIRILPVLKEGKRGVVPVEIRSNEAGEDGLPVAFDASLIDAETVRFGSKDDVWQGIDGAPESHGRTHGGGDRVLHFVRDETGLDGTEAEACVKGRYTTPGGETFTFFGCDTARW